MYGSEGVIWDDQMKRCSGEHENCGKMQHRGNESCGMISCGNILGGFAASSRLVLILSTFFAHPPAL